MKMFTCKYAQDEVTHQRLRVGSKKHALSLPEGSVQQGRSSLDGRGSVQERYVSGQGATCLRACASKCFSA